LVPRPRRKHPGRQRRSLQPAAARERDRQLREGRAAGPGQDRVRQGAGRLSRPRNVSRPLRESAMNASVDRSDARTDRETRSAAGDRSPWLIAVVVSIATFMQVLDTSIANVALRNIAGSLAAGIDESTWVITTYLIAGAVIVPISGWLMGIVGRKRFYMICVAIFTASSLLCGLAPSLSILIFFRIIQGLGGGGMVPSEQ